MGVGLSILSGAGGGGGRTSVARARRWLTTVSAVVMVAFVATTPAAAQRHPAIPEPLTVRELHRLLSDAHWPLGVKDGGEDAPMWSLPLWDQLWDRIETAFLEHLDRRDAAVQPFARRMHIEFPTDAWMWRRLHRPAALDVRDAALRAVVAEERVLFDAIRAAIEHTVPPSTVAPWRDAVDRAERRRRRSATLVPPRLMLALNGDVEAVVGDVAPQALNDHGVRELLDAWSRDLDGRLEPLAARHRETIERYRTALRNVGVEPHEDMDRRREWIAMSYPLWLDVSESLRAETASALRLGSTTVDAVAARLDAATARRLQDRWQLHTMAMRVRWISGDLPDHAHAAVAAWREQEFRSRRAVSAVILEHSPASWPLVNLGFQDRVAAIELRPALERIESAAEERELAAAMLREALGHGAGVTIVFERGNPSTRTWSAPRDPALRTLDSSPLFDRRTEYGLYGAETLVLNPPSRESLGRFGRAFFRHEATRQVWSGMVAEFEASVATLDAELGQRRALPGTFLRRPIAEPSFVAEMLATEAERTQRQSALESSLLRRAALLADPTDTDLILLFAEALRLEHLQLPMVNVIESQMAVPDDRRGIANPLEAVAVSLLHARSRPDDDDDDDDDEGRVRRWHEAVSVALDGASALHQLASRRSEQAQHFRADHLPRWMSKSEPVAPEDQLWSAAARWWRLDARDRAEAVRRHDEYIRAMDAILPEAGIATAWLAAAWPNVWGVEPHVMRRIETALANAEARANRGDEHANTLARELEALRRTLERDWTRNATELAAETANRPPDAVERSESTSEAIADAQARREHLRRKRHAIVESAEIRLEILTESVSDRS